MSEFRSNSEVRASRIHFRSTPQSGRKRTERSGPNRSRHHPLELTDREAATAWGDERPKPYDLYAQWVQAAADHVMVLN